MRVHMEQASRIVLGGFTVRTDVVIVKHPDPAWAVLMHLLQIAVWAFFYAWKHGMPDLTSAFYFSAVTYTTTGYGDLVLPKQWRLVGGVEALTGILMCGLSTGLFFAVFAKIFGLNQRDTPTA